VSRLAYACAAAVLVFFAGEHAALAADQSGSAPCPATIASGSDSVMVEGKQAARIST
jgi:uncharacterized Zn-binding protein involved in type VI secretion